VAEAPIIIDNQTGDVDNIVKPFQVEGESSEASVRGRAVRLGTVLDKILSAHNYPEIVAQTLGEVVVLTAMLGSMIKFDGKLTIQAKANGVIKLLVADYSSPDELRAYADVDYEKLKKMDDKPDIETLLGDGYLAMTIDQGPDMEQYQGIVELSGKTLADCAIEYFANSEQTPTALKLAAKKDPVTSNWRGGGIMVQHLPSGEVGATRNLLTDTKDQWDRASVFLKSVKDTELLDPSLDIDTLLLRLFHEDGVRVFEASGLKRGCRCSQEKLGTVLAQFSNDDLKDMAIEGKIEMTCEFCNKAFLFEV
jgi:molecular chaperone Hsp33